MCSMCDNISVKGGKLMLDTRFTDYEGFDVAQQAKSVLSNVNFDTIVGVGMSGMHVIPDMAGALGKNYVLLRRDGSGRFGIGRLGRRWLFVDDFTRSGGTYYFAQEQIKDLCFEFEYKSEFIGAYYYTTNEYNGACCS